MGDFLEMYEGLPFADGSAKKEVTSSHSHLSELEQLLRNRDTMEPLAGTGIFQGENMENFTDEDYMMLVASPRNETP